MKIMKLKKVITALIMLLLQASAFAVVLPSTPYSGGYSDAGTGMLYSDTGVMFSSSFTQLASGCSYPGEPDLCTDCCAAASGNCIYDDEPSEECITNFENCYSTCTGDHEQLAPLESRIAELMLCIMAVAVMMIRIAYNKVITNKN